MDFLLRMDSPIPEKDIGHIVNVAVGHARRVGAANDVDVIANGHVLQGIDERLRMSRERLDRFGGTKLALLKREQLQCEQLRKDDEVRAVV
jgi:hypothetical protein